MISRVIIKSVIIKARKKKERKKSLYNDMGTLLPPPASEASRSNRELLLSVCTQPLTLVSTLAMWTLAAANSFCVFHLDCRQKAPAAPVMDGITLPAVPPEPSSHAASSRCTEERGGLPDDSNLRTA
ncbi:hypothetical protein LX36DRAFT_424719 [Colletotrichum falcatum]|nr:hypothetical protein LX36DRAFT_424719 [Colletotrichum falcatum]